jgi:hypothetical protein
MIDCLHARQPLRWSWLVSRIWIVPKASAGPHLHREVAEVVYDVNGRGTIAVSSDAEPRETVSIRASEAIPLGLR